jgi:hypothetical protein
VATEFDRDDPIDRLLKGARRGGNPDAGTGEACLDAETLAAWAEGGLASSQARAVEAHVAECARCQAMTAAFAAADDAEAAPRESRPAPVVPIRRMPIKYWLPIAGTVAASLLVWIGVRDRGPQLEPAMSQATENLPERPAELPAAAPPPVLAQPKPESQPSAVAATANREQADLRKRSLARSERAVTQQAAPVAAPPLPVTTPSPPPSPPPPPPPALPVSPPARVVVPPAGTITGQQAMAAAGRAVSVDELLQTAQVVAEFSSALQLRDSAFRNTVGAGRGGAGGGRGGAAAARAAEDQMGPVTTHWRILANDVLQKSPDRKKWEPIALDPGFRGLANGAAPSSAVCWLVGRNGLVLLSTDGRQFARTASPTTSDLASIRAIDARQATVTTADGQSFRTTDGGKTWIRNN